MITFERSGRSLGSDGAETVLATARRAGLNIPTGCGFGPCGTCKVRKHAGEVVMVHNGGITDDEIEEGYNLAGCSRPQGAVTVDI